MVKIKTIEIMAFTLAEILITLGIIGVVAAITIPALINKTNDAELKTALKKNYAELSLALQQLANDNNGTLKNIVSAAWGDALTYKLSPYVQHHTISSPTFISNGLQTLGNCWHSTNTVKRLNGTQGTWGRDFYVDTTNSGCFITKSGAYWASYRYTNNCLGGDGTDCALFYIDVNGAAGPNQQGRDVHGFHIKESGYVKPFVIGEFFSPITATTIDCSTYGTGCATDILKGN